MSLESWKHLNSKTWRNHILVFVFGNHRIVFAAALVDQTGINAASTKTVIAGSVAIAPTAVDRRRIAATDYTTAIRCLQTRGNHPFQNLGHVLD